MIKISHPILNDKDANDIAAVLKSGMIVQGPKVKELEQKFAAYCDCKHAVAVNSGTAALHCALYALGVGPEDEVITTPFTFVATANSVLMQGAKVRFVDIDPETFCLDPKKLEAAITDKTKVIIPVSLFGKPYDKAIDETAAHHGIKVLEDAAQSIGATRDGRKSGSLSEIAIFSLYATKNISCGEGGMITTDNAEYAELCRRFRHHGQSEQTRYQYYDIGYNYRLSDIHACIGLNQIERIEEFTEARIKNAATLNSGLTNIPGLITPQASKGNREVYHQYSIRITADAPWTRDQVRDHLLANEIQTGIYYPTPLHNYDHFQSDGEFPISDQISQEILSLPVHPSLSEQDLNHIINTLTNLWNRESSKQSAATSTPAPKSLQNQQ